uniref:LRRNT domain-containing protein n=1 Tax=Strongyloides papillosus TaxID=174720 RepID=A0A0N5BXT5_STREA
MNFCLLLIFIFLNTIYGAIFKCLDNCECDDSEGVIHCHELKLTFLNLPKKPMENYRVLRLTDNNLEYLPSEEMLKSKFPQLTGVDVEGNSNFDCDSIKYYKRLTIFSDCTDKGIIESKKVTTTSSTTDASGDDDCDIQCKISNKAQEFANYAKRYWKKFVEKLEQFDRENKTWIEIKGVFKSFKNTLADVFNS